MNVKTIYIVIHCRKISNLFVQALEPGRKVSLWLNMNQVTEKLYIAQ